MKIGPGVAHKAQGERVPDQDGKQTKELGDEQGAAALEFGGGEPGRRLGGEIERGVGRDFHLNEPGGPGTGERKRAAEEGSVAGDTGQDTQRTPEPVADEKSRARRLAGVGGGPALVGDKTLAQRGHVVAVAAAFPKPCR